MSTLPPHDVPAVFWIDGAGQQQGPEPLATVIERIAHDQIPPSTPVWWQGAANWAPLNSNPEATDVLNARIAPAPAAAPAPEPQVSPFSAPASASPFGAPAPSPFSSPAPAESAAPFNSPSAFEAPTQMAAEPVDASTSVFEAPVTSFEPPAEATAPFSAPATTFEAPVFETPAVFVAPTAVPEVVVPEVSPALHASAPALQVADPETETETETEPLPTGLALGDASELETTFEELTARAERFASEQAAAEALDPALVAVVRQGLGDLGFTIEDSLSSDEYHSFRLTAADGSNASLAIQRVPSAPTVEAATERPLNCFVDHVGRASVGLFVGDYLGDTPDQALFTSHLAAIVNAAGK